METYERNFQNITMEAITLNNTSHIQQEYFKMAHTSLIPIMKAYMVEDQKIIIIIIIIINIFL